METATVCISYFSLWMHRHKWVTWSCCGTNHPKPEVKPETGGREGRKEEIVMDIFIVHAQW